MDEVYLMVAVRYIELNPVKARLVSKPELWKYSSAASHVYGKEDTLLSGISPLNEMIDNWKEFLRLTPSGQDIKCYSSMNELDDLLEVMDFYLVSKSL